MSSMDDKFCSKCGLRNIGCQNEWKNYYYPLDVQTASNYHQNGSSSLEGNSPVQQPTTNGADNLSVLVNSNISINELSESPDFVLRQSADIAVAIDDDDSTNRQACSLAEQESLLIGGGDESPTSQKALPIIDHQAIESHTTDPQSMASTIVGISDLPIDHQHTTNGHSPRVETSASMLTEEEDCKATAGYLDSSSIGPDQSFYEHGDESDDVVDRYHGQEEEGTEVSGGELNVEGYVDAEVEEDQIPSFNQIRRDLEAKNVADFLQPNHLRGGGVVLHPSAAYLHDDQDDSHEEEEDRQVEETQFLDNEPEEESPVPDNNDADAEMGLHHYPFQQVASSATPPTTTPSTNQISQGLVGGAKASHQPIASSPITNGNGGGALSYHQPQTATGYHQTVASGGAGADAGTTAGVDHTNKNHTNGNTNNNNNNKPPTDSVNSSNQQQPQAMPSSSPTGSNSPTDTSSSGGGRRGLMPDNSGRPCLRYLMSECQMSHVTVHLDKALVSRRARPKFDVAEITGVIFENLSPAIDPDSIRVELRGPATILDVKFDARPAGSGQQSGGNSSEQMTSLLKDEWAQCQRQIDLLTSRLERADKQRLVLDKFADNLIHQTDVTDRALPPHDAIASQPQEGGGKKGLLQHSKHGSSQQHLVESPNRSSMHQYHQDSAMHPYDPKHMESLQHFINLYEDQTERLDSTVHDSRDQVEAKLARMEQIEKELHDIELKQDEGLSRELSVLVEPREVGQIEMLISYVVGKCSWKPAYDIRIFNSDGTMKIVYYGMVQQATGEDWETRSMTLTTTQPGTGGIAPQLGVQRVHFKKEPSSSTSGASLGPGQAVVGFVTSPSGLPPNTGSNRSTSVSGGRSAGQRKATRSATLTHVQQLDGHHQSSVDREFDARPRTPIGTLQRGSSTELGAAGQSPGLARVRSSLTNRRTLTLGPNATLSSNYDQPSTAPSTNAASVQQTTIPTVHLEVPRPPAVIRCDNLPSRVTVGLLDLQPHYDYVAVPKRSLYAFLKATTVNKSNFSMLAGQTNIYADNTFIGKSELPAVAPGEEFSCPLGSENGIKLAYQPLYKCKESSGSGGKNNLITCKQQIEVRNSFDRPIKLMVVDQVPVSGEDKIKINLIEPNIKHPERYDRHKPIRMNKSSNVEWDIDLGPGESRELTLKYSIEHPITEDLEIIASEPV